MLVPTKAPAARRPARQSQTSPGPGRFGRSRRWRRVLTLAALICLASALISYGNTLSQPSDTSLSIRTVEWIRDNGARGLVTRIETFYSLNAPSTGGPPLRALPHQAVLASARAVSRRGRDHRYRPPRVLPVIHPALAGEGVWRATFAGGGSRPPVLVTSYRPQTWARTSSTRARTCH